MERPSDPTRAPRMVSRRTGPGSERQGFAQELLDGATDPLPSLPRLDSERLDQLRRHVDRASSELQSPTVRRSQHHLRRFCHYRETPHDTFHRYTVSAGVGKTSAQTPRYFLRVSLVVVARNLSWLRDSPVVWRDEYIREPMPPLWFHRGVRAYGILSLPIPFLGQKSSRANRSSMIFSEAKSVRSMSLLSLSRHPPCGIPVHFSRSPCESDCPPSHCFLAPGIPVPDSPRVHPDRDILSLVVDYSHTSRICRCNPPPIRRSHPVRGSTAASGGPDPQERTIPTLVAFERAIRWILQAAVGSRSPTGGVRLCGLAM